jgi:hypothetical protein
MKSFKTIAISLVALLFTLPAFATYYGGIYIKSSELHVPNINIAYLLQIQAEEGGIITEVSPLPVDFNSINQNLLYNANKILKFEIGYMDDKTNFTAFPGCQNLQSTSISEKADSFFEVSGTTIADAHCENVSNASEKDQQALEDINTPV